MRAVTGAVESGKSTLVAILTNGARGRPILDNGRGSARMAVFRHKHEIESGRTSSISQQVSLRGPHGIMYAAMKGTEAVMCAVCVNTEQPSESELSPCKQSKSMLGLQSRSDEIAGHVQMVGYDEDGHVLNYSGVAPLTPAEIATSARKVISPSMPGLQKQVKKFPTG